MAGGRRRTDVPDGLWGGTPADGSSDDPTTPGRSRRGPAPLPVGGSAPDGPVRIPRSRLPLPPVPVGPGGPRTTAAPFAAVPTPELPGGPTGLGRSAALSDHADHVAAPVLPRPARVWPQGEPALASPGPGGTAPGGRGSGPAARLPRPTTAAGAPSPAYGDWTKPSRSSGPLDLGLPADASGRVAARVPVAPATTAIPERPVNRGRRPADREAVARAEKRAPEPAQRPAREAASGPGTGAGRAAMRAQRQAADVARRKAAKRAGDPVGVPDDEPARGPRRVVTGLVAMAVVALGVLGVYTVVVPTEEAASGTPLAQSSAPSAPTATAVLPPLEDADLEVAVPATPAGPVRAPVTVLNATDVNGLAADVAGTIAAGGWDTPGVGTYLADDIATSTVFYTAGDETQRQAAESLKAQFPQLLTTAERFFEVPTDVAAPGLVVVLTAPW